MIHALKVCVSKTHESSIRISSKYQSWLQVTALGYFCGEASSHTCVGHCIPVPVVGPSRCEIICAALSKLHVQTKALRAKETTSNLPCCRPKCLNQPCCDAGMHAGCKRDRRDPAGCKPGECEGPGCWISGGLLRLCLQRGRSQLRTVCGETHAAMAFCILGMTCSDAPLSLQKLCEVTLQHFWYNASHLLLHSVCRSTSWIVVLCFALIFPGTSFHRGMS